ncbi:MAG: hypothetical protein ACRELD_00240 [Longimicrobiales bacterium]
MIVALASLLLQTAAMAGPHADSLVREARRFERVYERSVRWHAPLSRRGVARDGCDEIVGRFCLFFDGDDDESPIQPEPIAITGARRAAVNALRRAFGAAPEHSAVAAALVRYLVEDQRGAEAAAAARAYIWASADTAFGSMLLGFALHAAGDIVAADSAFTRALALMPPDTVRAIDDVSYLLERDERSRYRALSDADRAAYERRLWHLADPLQMLPGNAARTEHYARAVWIRLLPEAPWVRGMISWRADLAELTVRYGVPISRERIAGSFRADLDLLERYDTAQVTLVPAALLGGQALSTPDPGEPSPLDPPHPRSGQSPTDVRRLLWLPHQLTRFPGARGDRTVVRVDAAMALDSLARDADSIRVALFVLDSASLRIVAESQRGVAVRADTTAFALEAEVGPGSYVYRVEAFEPESRLATRALHSLAIVSPLPPIALSDPLIARPFAGSAVPAQRRDPALRPRVELILEAGASIGLYAELVNRSVPAAHAIELSIARESAHSLPGRAVRWIGRALGLGAADAAPIIRWEAAVDRPRMPLAVDLALRDLDAGLYRITLRVGDGTSTLAETSRIVRIAQRR